MSAVGMQCAVCGAWDGDGEPAVHVEQHSVIRVWGCSETHTAGETPAKMLLCSECYVLDPIRDEVDLFGNVEQVFLA